MTVAGKPISSYRLRARQIPPDSPRLSILTRPPLWEFVLLSMLLHATAILLFGAPSGGSREGRAMWGALQVVMEGAPIDAGPSLRIDRGLGAARTEARKIIKQKLEPRVAPARVEAVVVPQLKLDSAIEPAAIPALAPPPVVIAPRQTPPVVIPPLLDRIVTPERMPELTPFRLPPPTPVQAVPPPAPVTPPPVPVEPPPRPPPRIERAIAEPPPVPVPAPVPAPVAQPAPMPVPVPERVVTPQAEIAPVAAPVIPALPSTPAIERPPLEVPALPVETMAAPPAIIVPAPPAPVVVPAPASPAPAPPLPQARETPARIERAPLPRDEPSLQPSLPFRAPGPSIDSTTTNRGGEPAMKNAPTAPPLDLDAMRKRAGEMARAGSGNRAVLPFPMPPVPTKKTKIEDALDKAHKPDCRTAYAQLGLAAVVPLIANEFGEGTCRW